MCLQLEILSSIKHVQKCCNTIKDCGGGGKGQGEMFKQVSSADETVDKLLLQGKSIEKRVAQMQQHGHVLDLKQVSFMILSPA